MKQWLAFVLALDRLAVSSVSIAECDYPKPTRAVPNGATATNIEMIEAMKAIEQYDVDVKDAGSLGDPKSCVRVSQRLVSKAGIMWGSRPSPYRRQGLPGSGAC
jgi:hypothetical protein